jgi:hypothetical protein
MFVNNGAKGFFIFFGKISPIPPGENGLLLETGDFFLLETGDNLLLE